MLKKSYKHDIAVVVDRLVASDDILSRVTDSVETALGLAGGVMQVNFVDEEGDAAWQSFSEKLACPNGHPLQLTEIEPRTFSFNAPFGACPACSGLGTRMSVDVDLMLGDDALSIREGVLIPWTTQGKGLFQYYERLLEGLARDLDFSLDTPWRDLREEVQDAVLRGEDYKVTVRWKNRYGREMRYASGFEGVVPYIERQYLQAETDTQRVRWSDYLREVPCPVCNGDRLKPEVLSVMVHGHSIADASRLSLGEARSYFAQLQLTDREATIAAQVLREIRVRLDFLIQVGLNYLSLSRRAGDALRRRGAAHPAGDPDRLRPHRRAVRARRAVDRPAPARQPPPHPDAGQPPRPRQHADRGRARRRDHPRGGLDRRHRPRRRRRTAGTWCTPVRTTPCSPSRESITGDYLSGARDPDAQEASPHRPGHA